ncbi:MAG TPA: glycerol-3-phosphate 1-O-acyltransferase PlsY [Planctomycetes bacterium]|nr:glycerol-3-phosphate 1-O-acyltransferase PlsY [Planctomycetota bacterium]HIJ72172.1 glycerol-3-phosphate 1-O-acyltransferase PlsY [Planctomycetota bacterium]
MIESFVFLIALAYLLGSVPFGVLIAKAHGKDLRCIGSGNIGATNVARALGKRWAYVCFVLDCLKGLVPMLVGKLFISELTVVALSLWLAVGCAAVMGHIFPVYLRFKGGKGVATSLGMLLGLYPYYTIPGIITIIIWAAFVLIWKYISLASITAAVVFPLSLIASIIVLGDWRFLQLWPLIVVALVMGLLVVVRHAENIKRLLEGSETKVLQK